MAFPGAFSVLASTLNQWQKSSARNLMDKILLQLIFLVSGFIAAFLMIKMKRGVWFLFSFTGLVSVVLVDIFIMFP